MFARVPGTVVSATVYSFSMLLLLQPQLSVWLRSTCECGDSETKEETSETLPSMKERKTPETLPFLKERAGYCQRKKNKRTQLQFERKVHNIEVTEIGRKESSDMPTGFRN